MTTTKTTLLTVLYISFLTFALGQNRHALESPNPPLFKNENYCWGSAGIGPSTFGAVVNTHVAFQSNRHLFTLNFNYNFETLFSSEHSPTNIKELSLLYGTTFSNDWIKFSASTGISHIKYDEFIDIYYNSKGQPYAKRYINSAVGIPIQTEVFFPLYENLGFGITGMVNLNGIEPYTGFAMSIFIGKFP